MLRISSVSSKETNERTKKQQTGSSIELRFVRLCVDNVKNAHTPTNSTYCFVLSSVKNYCIINIKSKAPFV